MMKKYFFIIGSLFLLGSCELDENIDPNNPKVDQISARQRMVAAQTTTYNVQATSMNELGNIWMNSWAGNVYYFGNPASDETNLTLSTSFYDGIWDGMFLSVARLQAIIDSPNAAELPYHTAIAKILKGYYMQYIVDIYGDIPYDEIFKEKDNISPKYDNDEDVYVKLVDEVLEARKLIDDTAESDSNIVNSHEDVIFGGDMNKWKEFANTVLLKYAVRLSKTSNAKGTQLRDKIVQNLSNATYITADVKIQPGYSSATAGNQNPLYRAFGLRTNTGSINTYGWRLYRASTHMIETLKGADNTAVAGVYDPRIEFIFAPGYRSNEFKGLVQGALKDDLSLKDTHFSGFGGIFNKGASEGSAEDGVIMMLSEAELLQAEAAVAYPSHFSDGEDHYKKGVQASFVFAGKDDSASDYLDSIDDNSNIGWNSNKIAAIQYQKWIALTNYNGMETFINYQRTGYPETPLSISTSKPNKPYRLLYPSSEYTSNSSNVPNIKEADCFTINEYSPFWYK